MQQFFGLKWMYIAIRKLVMTTFIFFYQMLEMNFQVCKFDVLVVAGRNLVK